MSTTETDMTPEPDWLAAEPTARAKLTAIMAAVRRCLAECRTDPYKHTGPHMTMTMAEVFIGQLLIKAAGDEREACAQMAEQMGAGYYTREAILSGGIHPSSYEPFADLLREDS